MKFFFTLKTKHILKVHPVVYVDKMSYTLFVLKEQFYKYSEPQNFP